jgi:predicted peroxiredoxin
MLLSELFVGFLAERSVEALEQDLARAEKELKSAQSRALNNPNMKDQVERIKAQAKVIRRDISTARGGYGTKAELEARAAEKERLEKKAAETPEAKKERFGKAISAGQKAHKAIKADGGFSKIHAFVKDAHDRGVKVTADEIATHIGGDASSRTVNKWLELPANTSTARLLGRR